MTQNSYENRLTSLLDLKYGSNFYANNFVSFIQIGTSDGYTRYFPFTYHRGLSNPSSCLITSTYTTLCYDKYYTSKCSSSSNGFYYSYDARCRSWYELAEINTNTEKVYFQYPRISSSGQYVLTGVSAIVNNSATELAGVLNANFLVDTLSSSINSVKILDSGYYYVIDATNPEYLIVHPNASASCSKVLCAEGFTSEEYSIFQGQVLLPIQNGQISTLKNQGAVFYSKRGRQWALIAIPVLTPTLSIDYALLVTVPTDEIDLSSYQTQQAINQTVRLMYIVFTCSVVGFVILLIYITVILVNAIVYPFHDIREILEKAKQDDYSDSIADRPSTSYDMKVFYETFAKQLIFLRLSNIEAYAGGNQNLAKVVYEDALRLYTEAGNKVGSGSVLNNLGILELSLGNYHRAEELIRRSIEDSKVVFKLAQNDYEQMKAKNTYSDREGNLAVIYLEMNKLEKARNSVEKALDTDISSTNFPIHLRGCVVKQCILGQIYIKQKNLQAAQDCFKNALALVNDTKIPNADISRSENSILLQIILYNMALLEENIQKMALNSSDIRVSENAALIIESKYLSALTKVPFMSYMTCKKIFHSLRSLYRSTIQATEESQLMELAAKFRIPLVDLDRNEKMKGSYGGGSGASSVGFAIDFSGNDLLDDTKVLEALEHLQEIIDKRVFEDETLILARFSLNLDKVIPLMVRKTGGLLDLSGKNNSTKNLEAAMRRGSITLNNAIVDAMRYIDANFLQPAGTKLDDIDLLKTSHTISAYDKESMNYSEASRTSVDCEELNKLVKMIQAKQVGLLIIGINCVPSPFLVPDIVKAVKKQEYSFAKGDGKTIDEIFSWASMNIQGDVIVEDF